MLPLVAPIVAGLLTLLIGGAAITSVVATRQPCASAAERLDNNTATNLDMNALQQCNNDMVRNAQILKAGGDLIGSGGPVSGYKTLGPSIVTKVIKPVYDRQIKRMMQPAPAPATGQSGGASRSNPVNLAGTWTMRIDESQSKLYYIDDAVLTGPPGGPWRMSLTLRETNDGYWQGRLGYQDNACRIVLTGATTVNYDCQGVNNGQPYHRVLPGQIASGRVLGSGWQLYR